MAPPGTANTISATFVHFMKAEDDFINRFCRTNLAFGKIAAG